MEAPTEKKGPGNYGRLGALGTSWVFTTAIYFYLGYRVGMWLDARWQTSPFMLATGLFLAVVLSLATLLKEVFALSEAPPAKRENAGKTRQSEDRNEEADEPRGDR